MKTSTQTLFDGDAVCMRVAFSAASIVQRVYISTLSSVQRCDFIVLITQRYRTMVARSSCARGGADRTGSRICRPVTLTATCAVSFSPEQELHPARLKRGRTICACFQLKHSLGSRYILLLFGGLARRYDYPEIANPLS